MAARAGGSYHGFDLVLASERTSADAIALRDSWHEFARTGRVARWAPVGSATPWSTVLLRNGAPANNSVGWKRAAWDAVDTDRLEMENKLILKT